MSDTELAVLNRAHELFTGSTATATVGADTAPHRRQLRSAAELDGGRGWGRYRLAADHGRQQRMSAARVDAHAAAVIASAQQDRASARDRTRNVLDEARAETAVSFETPLAQREAIRRRAARLRAQRAHVLAARLRSRKHAAALRALRYRMMHRSPNGRAALAVRAALSRLGCPYVWGATGPNQFDCSGLVQWSYAQAGIHLDRTTYQQIDDGTPVPRSRIRPGDLVFPHAGHVQLAIG
ncbi:MAG: C40 family peptidase, partial [Mycobacterium sp.]|nr:C40 family peptidase [Mycobacterium sp.]